MYDDARVLLLLFFFLWTRGALCRNSVTQLKMPLTVKYLESFELRLDRACDQY